MDHALLQEDHCLHHCIITIRSPRKSFITRIFLCPELSNSSSHGLFLSRIIELSNCLHTDFHGASRIYISCHELSNLRIIIYHTDFHGASRIYISCPELSNLRIIIYHTDFHGESRIYISCHEFANSIIRDKEKHPWSSAELRVKRIIR